MIIRDDRRTSSEWDEYLYNFMVLVQTMRLEQIRFRRHWRSGGAAACVESLRAGFILEDQVDRTISAFLDPNPEGQEG